VQHSNGIYYGAADGSANSESGNVYSLIPQSPIQILKVAGPVWVKPGDPVEILGENLKTRSAQSLLPAFRRNSRRAPIPIL
jgi:hypothetical protein